MNDIRPDRLQEALTALEQAIATHEAWYEQLIRLLICAAGDGRADLQPDAHLHCSFGRWYRSEVPQELREIDGFEAVGATHEALHRGAAAMLSRRQQNLPISEVEYDEFAESRALLLTQLRTLRLRLEERLYRRDQLTGAENRMDLMPKLNELQAMVERGAVKCTLALMDLDHFKSINDTHGHQVGDQVLVETTSQVRRYLRPYDKVFRYGGEEFLIALPDTSVAKAFTVIERVRQQLAENEFVTKGGASVRVTTSFGLAAMVPQVSVEDVIGRADVALYAAKSAGRNRTTAWSILLGEHSPSNPSVLA